MSVNEQLVGREHPPIGPYQVSREAIRAFAEAVGAQSSVHRDVAAAQEAGHQDLVAPPTFAILVAQRAEAVVIRDPESGIDFSRVVHADQRFTHTRPILAGDQLVAATTVSGVRAMGAGAMVTFTTRIALTDGAEVSTARSSLLVRGDDQ